MSIHWFPGHMAKARRLMNEQLKAIDIIVELRDARIPLASENPMLVELAPQKARVLVFTKIDLADAKATQDWKEYFSKQDIPVVFVNTTGNSAKKEIIAAIELAGVKKRERDASRGIKNRALKSMIVGVPNVGKSTLINSLAKKKMAKVADRPGITRTVTWIPINKQLVLMDTPGVLWPKFEDPAVGMKLAITNAIKEQVLPVEEILIQAYAFIKKHYYSRLIKRYELEDKEYTFEEFITHVGNLKNMVKQNGELDSYRVQQFFFLELKNHKLGPMSWEFPNE
jgi:ribosome biogenesis GTPase A